jgi:branched-chain amino acid transport system ATP-binding protein
LEQSNTSILRVEDLSVSYGMVSALVNVTMKALKGEFVTLIGANGAGKSTFLQTIIGISKPRQGKINFMGQDITLMSTDRIVAMGISMCPEGRGLLPKMTVLDNLLLGAYHSRHAINTSLKKVFETFPILEKRTKQSAGTLSGGEQQMLSIGRALMGSPKILMLDEPSLGLAPIVVNEVFQSIGQLAGGGYTILLSEQNAKKALDYASRGYVFETGRIVLEGNSEELKRNPAVVEAYLGGS